MTLSFLVVEDVSVNSGLHVVNLHCQLWDCRLCLSGVLVLYVYVIRGIVEVVGCLCVFIDMSVYVCEHLYLYDDLKKKWKRNDERSNNIVTEKRNLPSDNQITCGQERSTLSFKRKGQKNKYYVWPFFFFLERSSFLLFGGPREPEQRYSLRLWCLPSHDIEAVCSTSLGFL
jgi:hypothetical protein